MWFHKLKYEFLIILDISKLNSYECLLLIVFCQQFELEILEYHLLLLLNMEPGSSLFPPEKK